MPVKNSASMKDYEIIIQPNQSWLYIDWQGLLHYRDLLYFLVKRNFIAVYKQTILGPIWFILQPLLTTLVFTVVFGQMAKIPTDGLPPMLFYLCGLSIWNYFAKCTNDTSAIFITNSALFGKVYFPRLVVPLAVIISQLITFVIQLITFLVFYFYFVCFTPAVLNIKPNMFLLLLPLLLLHTAVLSLGVGLWVSSITAKYRDISFVMVFMLQLWMYITPIIYPMSMVPVRWKFLVAINPLAPILEVYRYAFFGMGNPFTIYLLISILISVLILFTGMLIFNKTERTVIDTV